MKRKVLEYSITALVGVLFTFILLWTKGIFTQTDIREILKYYIDSFFTSGVLLLAAGLIVVASDGGAFDFLVYGVYRFFSIFKSKPNDVKYKTYYDYSIAHNDKEPHSRWHLIIVGGILTAISIIILIFWYQIPVPSNP